VQRGFEDRNIAGYPNGAMSIAIGETLVQDGCRVILNGEGGDEWLAGKRFYFAEQLAARDWKSLAASFREDLAALGPRMTAWNLYRYGAAPMLPRWLLDARLRLRDAIRPDSFSHATWLAPDMLELLEQRRAARDRKQFTSIRNPAQRSMYMVMTDPFAIIVWDQFSRHSARIGYEIRTPMYARKFIEFAFSTPERIRLRGNIPKYIHIAALAGLLPEVVANRKTKAEFSFPFNRHLLAKGGLLTHAVQGNGSGFLNPKCVGELQDRYRGDRTQGRETWALWSMFEIEGLFGPKS
jgi:asparagine synthase (glutamine-hydrolysing)